MQRILPRRKKTLEKDGFFFLSFGKIYWRTYFKYPEWAKQRNVYSMEIRGGRIQAHLRGVPLGVDKDSELCMKYWEPRPRNPQCLSVLPSKCGMDGAQLQKIKGPFQLGLRCLSCKQWWEGRQKEWDWSSLQPVVIGVQKGIQLGSLRNPR